jgi:hypothetical protein
MKIKIKWIFILLVVSSVLFVCLFILQKISSIYSGVKTTIADKNELMRAVTARDLGAVEASVSSLRKSTDKLNQDIRWIRYFSILPGVGGETQVTESFLTNVDYLLDSADLAIKLIHETGIDVFATSTDFSSAIVLKKIDLAVSGNINNISKLAERGDEIVKSGLMVSKIKQINLLQEKISSYVRVVSQATRLLATTEEGVASVLGLRGEKKYLLLFQNSDELRPGGGIISTYGLIYLKDGQVTSLTIDHVKNLELLYALPLEVNPVPIQQTMRHQKNLYIYDANWLGDPEAWLEKIYRSWNAQKTPVDGIIVMSTKMLEEVVGQYEPIKMPGTNEVFTAKDVVSSLDYYFDVEHNLYDFSKYKVLAPLAGELISKIKSSKIEQLQKLMVNMKKGLQSRDLFVYTKDQLIIGALKNNGIQNNLSQIEGDEFYAVEANLGSGKADGRIKRALAINVYAQEENPVSMVKITQDYTSGVDDYRASGYYGYLRFFLPLGSKLGAFENFNKVEDENIIEAKRQVYGNYYSVAIGTKKDAGITYALADSVAKQIKDGKYSLMLRKQGGVEMPFEIKIYISDTWKKPKIMVSDGTVEYFKEQSLVTWRGKLTKDMQIEIMK